MSERDLDVLVIGAGHGGLAMGHELDRLRRRYLIVDRAPRVGTSWRERWTSLRLFTPVQVSGLPGLPFRQTGDPFPSKDEVADYQERYAAWRGLAVRLGTEVTSLRQDAPGIVAETADGALRARRAVVATSVFSAPRVPEWAARLAPHVVQLHSARYREPRSVPGDRALVIGSGASGCEIALDLSATHRVTLAVSRRMPEAPPWFHSIAAWRVARWRNRWLHGAVLPLPWPLRPGRFESRPFRDAARDGRVALGARAVDAAGDEVVLADGRRVPVDAVVWAIGYDPALDWIEGFPGSPLDARGRPRDRLFTHGRVHVLAGPFLYAVVRQAEEAARAIARTLD